MVTFRKDIHLGRRVPYFPQGGGNGDCWFTDITEKGVATDKLGRRWQFAPFEERTESPRIVITDVTTDPTYGYTTEQYPLINGQRGAVRLIEIFEGEEDSNIEYKIVKNDIVPSIWSQYDDPIALKDSGRYYVIARAQKVNSKYSLEVQSDEFDVVPKVLQKLYAFVSQSIDYGTLPASAGEKVPEVKYGVKVSGYYTDEQYRDIAGFDQDSSPFAEILAFQVVAGTGYYLTLEDAATGRISYPANGGITERVNGTIKATITLKDDDNVTVATALAETNVKQAGVEATDNVIIWDADPSSSSHIIGDTVNFAAHTADGAVISFKKGNTAITPISEDDGVYSGSFEVTSATTIITANAAAQGVHRATSSSKTVSASAPVIPMYWGVSLSTEYVPAQASPYSSGTTLISDLDYGGTFESGAVKDYGSVLIASIYFAVPRGKNVSIAGAAAGGDVTSEFTKIVIGDYDVYYQVGFIQEKFTITVS